MKNKLQIIFLNRLHFLQIPELKLSNDIIHEFDELYNHLISTGPESTFTYSHHYPKYLFLNYLLENQNILIHGSNNPEINIFEPRDQTLFNGNKARAVFASSDGIWSLFFAIVNKSEYTYSLRNLCFTAKTNKGIKRYYYFSVNKEFQGKLWTDGMIYILPKRVFRAGGIKDEWISDKKVEPLAKIEVSPDDFIFRNEVRRYKHGSSHMKNLITNLVFNR